MNFDWETLYKAKAAELILYGRALGLSHGEAEDVLQETFLVLLKSPQRPLEPEHYCVRSFRNRALNHRRSLWRRLTRELEVLADGHHWFEKSSDETERSMQTAAVDCLAALPVEQREAIVLKIWHRFTFEEIGGLLGISPNTAAGRYRYGLQKIKRQLAAVALARLRVGVEHTLAGVKRCHIVADIYRNTKADFEDAVMLLAGGLHNFRVACRFAA